MSYWEEQVQEKRNGPDTIIKWVHRASIFVWIILSIFIFITDLAKPEDKTMFDHMFGVSVRSSWDTNLLFIAFIVALVMFLFSIVSLMFNAQRLKRKTDKVSVSLIISLITAAVYVLFYLYSTLDIFTL